MSLDLKQVHVIVVNDERTAPFTLLVDLEKTSLKELLRLVASDTLRHGRLPTHDIVSLIHCGSLLYSKDKSDKQGKIVSSLGLHNDSTIYVICEDLEAKAARAAAQAAAAAVQAAAAAAAATPKAKQRAAAVAAGRTLITPYPTPKKDVVAPSDVGKQIYDAAYRDNKSELEALCREWAGNKVIDQYGPPSGKTAMAKSAHDKRNDCVRILLAAGADPELGDSDGWNSLIPAVAYENPSLARLLIDEGASVTAVTTRGETVLEKARGTECQEMVRAALKVIGL